jgi:hypothetical protein
MRAARSLLTNPAPKEEAMTDLDSCPPTPTPRGLGSPRQSHPDPSSADLDARALLAALESRPDLVLLDELREIDPAMERRFRLLVAQRSELEAEAYAALALAGPLGSATLVQKLTRRLTAVRRAEDRALLDAYMMDLGGEGD